MVYVAASLWPWLLAATTVGLAMGWISIVHRGNGLSRAGMQRTGLFIAALIVVSLLRILPGRPGFWLDLGLVMLVFYIVGCIVGAQLRHLVVSRQTPQF